MPVGCWLDGYVFYAPGSLRPAGHHKHSWLNSPHGKQITNKLSQPPASQRRMENEERRTYGVRPGITSVRRVRVVPLYCRWLERSDHAFALTMHSTLLVHSTVLALALLVLAWILVASADHISIINADSTFIYRRGDGIISRWRRWVLLDWVVYSYFCSDLWCTLYVVCCMLSMFIDNGNG